MTETEHERRYAAVVVAAGRGERAGSPEDGPKQYRLLGGRPVLRAALDPFLKDGRIGRIVVVTHKDDDALFQGVLSTIADKTRLVQVHGGATRQQSVLAGLNALESSDATHVLIHDAARPFLSASLIDRIDAAFAEGADAVLPAVAVPDTLKRASGGHVSSTVSREALFAAQTPQGFRFAPILQAHRRAAAEGRADFTDDCAIAEAVGVAVRIVEGDIANSKITTARDLEMANRLAEAAALPDIRTGNGYDVHRLVPGTGVTLCGIRLPHDQALSGHSDADVGLHALTDALLATCGAGDIGDHFPPSDEKWKGAASRVFVSHAVAIVAEAGGTIMNADISLIAEAPRIGPHRTAMREAMADMLGIDIERCSVKATTNEQLGFVGRREGIAAFATATVLYRRRQQ